jgi:hypothetical protein
MGNKFAFPVLRPVSVLYPDEIIVGQSPADASHAILQPAFDYAICEQQIEFINRTDKKTLVKRFV